MQTFSRSDSDAEAGRYFFGLGFVKIFSILCRNYLFSVREHFRHVQMEKTFRYDLITRFVYKHEIE